MKTFAQIADKGKINSIYQTPKSFNCFWVKLQPGLLMAFDEINNFQLYSLREGNFKGEQISPFYLAQEFIPLKFQDLDLPFQEALKAIYFKLMGEEFSIEVVPVKPCKICGINK